MSDTPGQRHLLSKPSRERKLVMQRTRENQRDFKGIFKTYFECSDDEETVAEVPAAVRSGTSPGEVA